MKKILAVDDSKTMRDMISFTLKNAGYDVQQAQDGREALQMVEERGPFDAVITDLNMPHIDGYALVEQLRGNPAYRTTPILMLTTESDDEKKQRGKASGASGWIIKPFNPEKLVEVLQKLCA